MDKPETFLLGIKCLILYSLEDILNVTNIHHCSLIRFTLTTLENAILCKLEMFHTASSPSLQHQAIKPCSETVPDISSPACTSQCILNTQNSNNFHAPCL